MASARRAGPCVSRAGASHPLCGHTPAATSPRAATAANRAGRQNTPIGQRPSPAGPQSVATPTPLHPFSRVCRREGRWRFSLAAADWMSHFIGR